MYVANLAVFKGLVPEKALSENGDRKPSNRSRKNSEILSKSKDDNPKSRLFAFRDAVSNSAVSHQSIESLRNDEFSPLARFKKEEENCK